VVVRQWFPKSEMLVVQKATHWLQLTNPTGLAEGLAIFFRKLPKLAKASYRALYAYFISSVVRRSRISRILSTLSQTDSQPSLRQSGIDG
jgi:hypothetical protein